MEWKMIDKMNTEMKEESKNSEFSTKDREMSASLNTDKLRRMGFHYPELALRVIEAVERGDDIETLEGGLIKSRIIGKINGHHVLTIALEDESYFFYMGEEMPASFKIDSMLFLDRKWVPTTNVNLLCKVIESLNGKSVEEALECLKEEETETSTKPEEDTPAPANHDSEGEQIQIMKEGSSDVIVVNKAAACDDTAKAKDSDKEEATEKRPNNLWTQSINDIEFTRIEFDKAKAKQAAKSEAPCDLQCAVSFCKDIFEKKCGLYGLSFSEMHLETLTDQLFMKATILKKRLTERDKGERFEYDFFEGVRDEFAAVVNYGIIALRQSVFSKTKREFDAPDDLMQFYLEQTRAALSLICDKSADYGHLWRSQRIGTYADMIYTKVLRVKRIENQYRVGGMTEEGYHKFVEDQYRDMINYGLFGVVRTDDICNVLALTVYEDEEEFE